MNCTPRSRRRGGPGRRCPPAGYRAQIESGLTRLSAQVGLELKNHDRLINSRPALQAAEFARAAGLFEPMHRALFDAYWLEGRDVSDLGVLREIGARVGLDVDAMEAAVRANSYGEYLDARRAEALDLMIGRHPGARDRRPLPRDGRAAVPGLRAGDDESWRSATDPNGVILSEESGKAIRQRRQPERQD